LTTPTNKISVNEQEVKEMRTGGEIRKWLELLEKERENKRSFTERENIARKAIKQALL